TIAAAPYSTFDPRAAGLETALPGSDAARLHRGRRGDHDLWVQGEAGPARSLKSGRPGLAGRIVGGERTASGRAVPRADDIRHHEARLARDPSSQAYAALAEAYRRGGRLDDAIRVCRQGLERHPTYSTARFILAKVLLDRDEVVEARAEVERFLQAEPD